MTENPFETPESTPPSPEIRFEGLSPETVRRDFLGHEASVQSIGCFYYIAAVILGVGGLGVIVDSVRIFLEEGDARFALSFGLASFALLPIAAGAFLVGRGLGKLRPWVRTPVLVLALVSLVLFPIGTLIGGYIVYLLVSEKGKVVFSQAYRKVIDATPQIQYRTSPALIASFALVAVVVWVIALVNLLRMS